MSVIDDMELLREQELWQKWQQPEIWRLPHGHVSGLFVPGLMGRVVRWRSPRLEAGRKNNAGYGIRKRTIT